MTPFHADNFDERGISLVKFFTEICDGGEEEENETATKIMQQDKTITKMYETVAYYEEGGIYLQHGMAKRLYSQILGTLLQAWRQLALLNWQYFPF